MENKYQKQTFELLNAFALELDKQIQETRKQIGLSLDDLITEEYRKCPMASDEELKKIADNVILEAKKEYFWTYAPHCYLMKK